MILRWWRMLLKTVSTALGRFRPGSPLLSSTGHLDREQLQSLLEGIFATRPDELDCGACFEQVGCYADLHLAGKSAAEAMPLVQDHVARCQDCREEFTALLRALQAYS